MSVEVQVLEDGEVVERKLLGPDGYVVICGESRVVTHENHYPRSGTVQLTIKRVDTGATDG